VSFDWYVHPISFSVQSVRNALTSNFSVLVNMPEWIAQTNMDPQSVGKVKEEMTLLNQWICRNHQRLFINQYERPSAEYIEHARD